MGQINELACLVKELEEQVAVCIRCGMCQSVCPLFEQTGKEADVARGKLALLNGLMTQVFKDPEGVSERLNRCLLCGSCAANCPSGVNVLEIFIRARAILTGYTGLSLAKKIIFKRLLSSPETLNTLMGWASIFQSLMAKSNKNTQGTSCARFGSTFFKERHFLPIAGNPFHKTLAQIQPQLKQSGPRVLLFTGCLIDKIMPQIAKSCVEALSHNKVQTIVPDSQGCCGIPALAAGDKKAFNALVAYHIDLFKKQDFDCLVTACATCTSTIKKLWPSLYRENDIPFLEKLAVQTMDINQFLVDVIQVGPPPQTTDSFQQEPVTCHDPCHLKKSLGIFTQPRQILKASGHPVTEMTGADRCCGMGGSFNLLHYDLSSRIGRVKKKHIMDTGCEIVATGCPACIMQISDMLSRSDSRIKVKHPIELYAQALRRF